MLVQTPSQIFKADFAFWKKENKSVLNQIISNQNNAGHIKSVTEIILDENGSFEFESQENSTLIILTLYGKIQLNRFRKVISPEEVFTLKSKEKLTVTIRNYLNDEKTNILIIELQSLQPENAFFFEDLHIEKKNTLIPVSKKLEFPNFIGLYEGRKEEMYSLYNSSKMIFGMVINGAFEFQNRLLETRDSIILRDIQMLEFEALSENALIIFFEI
jgi:quercetin 2,3-dioxygenase